MLRRGAGSGILMGAMLCAIGGGLSLVGSRQHGPGGPQIIYLGVVILGALRILLALIPRLRRSNRQPAAQPQAVATYATGAPYTTGAPYVPGTPYTTGAPYVPGTPYATGAPASLPAAPPAPASYTPVHSAPGRCWDCGSRVRLDSAICFHCGAAQVNAYQRATGRPASSTTSGPAPAPTDSSGMSEYPRYEPARPY